MNKKNVEIQKIASPMPFYISIGIAILATFLFPMYKFASYLGVAMIGAVSFVIIKKLNIFKDQEIEVEIPVTYASTEIEELMNLATEQISKLKVLNRTVDKVSVHNNIDSIIQTSQLIVEYVNENQKIEKDVRKYFRYYLDEIVKMVKHYDTMEEKEDSENIETSKSKIESTIANAEMAFRKFYNDLYTGKAMDINVDTKVFDDMLKQLQK